MERYCWWFVRKALFHKIWDQWIKTRTSEAGMSFELSRKRVIVGCYHHPTTRFSEECIQLQEKLIAQSDPKGHAVASQLWLWWPWRAWKSSRASFWGVGQLSGAEGANFWGTQRLLWGACEWPEGSYVLCLQGSIYIYINIYIYIFLHTEWDTHAPILNKNSMTN